MLSAALAPVAIIVACSQTLPGPPVCSASRPCSAGNTCVLGRCRVDGTQPLSLGAARLSFSPRSVALIDGDRVLHGRALGSALELGERDRPQQLFMAFAVSVPEGRRVQRALLSFEPLPSCPHATNNLSLSLRRILGSWQPHTLRKSAPPRTELPMPFAEQHVQGGPLRLDVTELVRSWVESDSPDTGIALAISGDGQRPSCFSTGLDYGVGPQLQVFLWPEEDAGTDADADGAARDGGGGESAAADEDDEEEEQQP